MAHLGWVLIKNLLKKGISKEQEESWSQAIENKRNRTGVGQIDRNREKRNILPEEEDIETTFIIQREKAGVSQEK